LEDEKNALLEAYASGAQEKLHSSLEEYISAHNVCIENATLAAHIKRASEAPRISFEANIALHPKPLTIETDFAESREAYEAVCECIRDALEYLQDSAFHRARAIINADEETAIKNAVGLYKTLTKLLKQKEERLLELEEEIEEEKGGV